MISKEETILKNKQPGFVGFIFLVKEDAAFAAIKKVLLKDFNLLFPANVKEMVFNQFSAVNYYLQSKSHKDVVLRLRAKPFKKSIDLQLVWLKPRQPNNSCWLFEREFLSIVSKINKVAYVLGTSQVYISTPNQVVDKQALKEKFGTKDSQLIITADGQLNFFPSQQKNKHLYILESKKLVKGQIITSNELLVLDWTLHRLQKLKAGFSSKLQTIHAERTRTDKKLSNILFDKISHQNLSQDKKEFFENQLFDLAKMYSLTATNLHLAREAVAGAKTALRDLQNFTKAFTQHCEPVSFPLNSIRYYQKWLAEIAQEEKDLKTSLGNIKAAIDLIGSQVELLRDGEAKELLNQNVILQKERSSFQSAARLIELVVIFYYSLKSWEAIAPAEAVHHLPPSAKFLTVALFSGAVVILTHKLGHLKKERLKGKWLKLSPSFALIGAALFLMVMLPFLYK